jgi:hypothetical protein
VFRAVSQEVLFWKDGWTGHTCQPADASQHLLASNVANQKSEDNPVSPLYMILLFLNAVQMNSVQN